MAVNYAASPFNRQMIVPRTQTADTLLEFFKSHRTEAELAQREKLRRQLGVWVEEDTGGKENSFAKDFDGAENEVIFKHSTIVADKCISLGRLS